MFWLTEKSWIMNFVQNPNRKHVMPDIDNEELNVDTQPPTQTYPEYKVTKMNQMNSSKKSITDINTLKKWDKIIDHEWNQRFVVWVCDDKVIMTWKNVHINNFKKTYTWNVNKFHDAIRWRGFRLAK